MNKKFFTVIALIFLYVGIFSPSIFADSDEDGKKNTGVETVKYIEKINDEIANLESKLDEANCEENSTSQNCKTLKAQIERKKNTLANAKSLLPSKKAAPNTCEGKYEKVEELRSETVKDCKKSGYNLDSCIQTYKKCLGESKNTKKCPFESISNLKGKNKTVERLDKEVAKYKDDEKDHNDDISKLNQEVIEYTQKVHQAQLDQQNAVADYQKQMQDQKQEKIAESARLLQELDKLKYQVEDLQRGKTDLETKKNYDVKDLELGCYDEALRIYNEKRGICLARRQKRIREGKYRTRGFGRGFFGVHSRSCSESKAKEWRAHFASICRTGERYKDGKKRLEEKFNRDSSLADQQIKRLREGYNQAYQAYNRHITVNQLGYNDEQRKLVQLQKELVLKVQEAQAMLDNKKAELSKLIISQRELQTLIQTEESNLLKIQATNEEVRDLAAENGVHNLDKIEDTRAALNGALNYFNRFGTFSRDCCDENKYDICSDKQIQRTNSRSSRSTQR